MENMQELQDMTWFRFVPTTQVLLSFYLTSMITGENPFTPDMIIPYIPYIEDLYSMSPERIVEQMRVRVDREFIYAYTRVKKVVEGGKNIARATKVGEDGSGKGKFWKLQNGEEVKLENGEVGMRRALSYSVKNSNGSHESTHWVMHEYSLPGRGSDLVICRLHYDAKRASSSSRSSSGCSTLSSVEQSQILPSHPPLQPQCPPMKRMMVSNDDRNGATSDLVRATKKNKVSSTMYDESHVQRQQFARPPCEKIISQSQETQCNNQETCLVDQVIQDHPQDDHQVQEVPNITNPLEEIYRPYGDTVDPFGDISFTPSGSLGDGWDEFLDDVVIDESLLAPLDDPDPFKDLPQFSDR